VREEEDAVTFTVALTFGTIWFGMAIIYRTKSNDQLVNWAFDVCRIVFAAATLVTLLSMAGRPVF
jgi:hypothetical protein